MEQFNKRIVSLLLLLGMLVGMMPMTAFAAEESTQVTQENPWDGKSAVFVGDSITAGTGTTKIYYEYLKESLGFGSVSAMGVPGSCFSAASDYGQSTKPLISRYQSIPSADLIMVFMGTNDYGHETPIGTVQDMGDGTFYGVLNTVVSDMVAKHPYSKIVFVTPLHRYGFGTSKILGTKFTYDHIPNGVGATLGDYADVIKTVCANHGVSVIDLHAECPFDPTNDADQTSYIPDGLHPNAVGHELIAAIMESYIRSYNPVEKESTNYRWESTERGFENVTTGNNSANPLSTISGYIENGVLNKAHFALQTPIVLKHDSEWAIEWKASGNWSGILLSENSKNTATNNKHLYKSAMEYGLIAMGIYRNGNHHNYGVDVSEHKLDFSGEHVYRIENRIHADGANMAYLIVDGVECGAMDAYYIGGNSNQNQDVAWISGEDFTFGYIGTTTLPLINGTLDYIQVWEAGHTHTYTPTVTAPTCTERGYTTYTCACGESYVDDYVDMTGHRYDTGFMCSECGYKAKVSVLGDSISTYSGITGVKNPVYPNNTVKSVLDTWWKQVIDALGGQVHKINASGGSRILSDEYFNGGGIRDGNDAAYRSRCENLHIGNDHPDVILVFLGTNDFSYHAQSECEKCRMFLFCAECTSRGDGNLNVCDACRAVSGVNSSFCNLPLGTANNVDISREVPTSSCEAYAIMLSKMQEAYPNARIYCLGLLPRKTPYQNAAYHDHGQPTFFNAELQKVAENAGAVFIDLEHCVDNSIVTWNTYFGDTVHPTAIGMDKIARTVISGIVGSEVYMVDFQTSGSISLSGQSWAFAGNTYEASVVPVNDSMQFDVHVTMNGVDITETAYDVQTAKIHIDCVTGNIIITAKAKVALDEITWSVGAVNSTNGSLVAWSNRIHTNMFDVTQGATITAGNGAEFCPVFYDKNGCFVSSPNVYDADGLLQISAGQYVHMRLMARNKNDIDAALTPDYGKNITVAFGLEAANWSIGTIYCGDNASGLDANNYSNRIRTGYIFVGNGIVVRALNNAQINVVFYDENFNILPTDNNCNWTTEWSSANASDATAYIRVVAKDESDAVLTADYGENVTLFYGCIHTYIPTVTAPTCTEQGYTTYTCACGDSYVDDYVDATGHTFSNSFCTACGTQKNTTAKPIDDGILAAVTPENYLTISNPATEKLACAPGLVTYGDGKMAVVYLADDVNSVETESSTTIVCRLGLFNPESPQNGTFLDIAAAGQTIGDVTIGQKAPYEPNLLALEDGKLLVLFNIRDASGKYIYYSATVDPESKTVTDYAPLTLDGKSWIPANIAASYNAIADHSISSSGPVGSMVFTSQIVNHGGYYYGYCGGICAGFSGILVRSTDGVNWTSVMTPEALPEMAGVIECGFRFFGDYIYFCMRDISSGVYQCSYNFNTGEQMARTHKLSNLTTSKPAAFTQDGKLYLIVNKDTGDDAVVGRRNTAMFYEVDPVTCRLTLVRQIFCADGCAYHSVVHVNGTNYWAFHTDARRINPYTQGRSNLAFREMPVLYSHAYESVVTAPTCTAQGYTTHICTICGDSYVDSYVDAVGHRYESNICIGCGKEKNGILNLTDYSHMYASGCITVAANVWQSGVVNYHYQIPLSDFVDYNQVTVKANSTNKSYVAFFTQRMTKAGAIAYADGWTEVLILEPGTSRTLPVPADAQYLYILNNNAAGDSLLPESVVFSCSHVYANGICTICGEPDPNHHVPGDINGDGDVNNKDLTRLFKHLSGYEPEVVEAALDVNGDGSVNNKDLTRLFRYLSGWDVTIE